jgi:type II secretory pathway component PulK
MGRNIIISASSGRRGVMLIIVMWISLGLISIALFFCNSMLLEYRASDNGASGFKASQAIEGARRYITFVLENVEEPGYMPDPASYESEQATVDDAAFWLIGRGEKEGISDNKPFFGLIDECSKLNLNTATLDMLEALPGMTPELAASIIDWRDTNTEPTANGAESQYYLQGNPPYRCKDGSFETVDELRLVMGGTFDVLYGEDVNRNGILDANENDGDKSYPDDNADGQLTPGIVEYVTVYSREPNKRDDGSARINIRTNRQGLDQLLQETFGQQRADQIQQATGRNLGNIGSVLEYYVRSGMTQNEFSQIADALTVSDGEYLQGLVNVNTASAAVLACLPGVGQEFADKLVASRKNKSTDDLKTVAWVTNVLDTEHAVKNVSVFSRCGGGGTLRQGLSSRPDGL